MKRGKTMQLFKIISMIMFTLTIGIAFYTFFNADARYNPIVIVTALTFLALGFLMRFIAWRLEINVRD